MTHPSKICSFLTLQDLYNSKHFFLLQFILYCALQLKKKKRRKFPFTSTTILCLVFGIEIMRMCRSIKIVRFLQKWRKEQNISLEPITFLFGYWLKIVLAKISLSLIMLTFHLCHLRHLTNFPNEVSCPMFLILIFNEFYTSVWS